MKVVRDFVYIGIDRHTVNSLMVFRGHGICVVVLYGIR